jgi:hypothetical protein
MKCAKAQRELLWLARFGELGPSSQPHLDHLAGCRGCRDEVGFDRLMVQQLRIALAERVENARPSPHAWEAILERAQLPEPRRAGWLWHRSAGVVGRLRMATAMAGTGLAVILALNMQIGSYAVPATDAESRSEATSLQQVPRLPTGRTALVAYMLQSNAASSGASRPDPEVSLTQAPARLPQRPASAAAEDDATGAITEPQVRLVFRIAQTPDPHGIDARVDDGVAGDSAPSSGSAPGEPS